MTEPDTTPEPDTPAPTEPAATAPETPGESDTRPQKKGCGAALDMASVAIPLAACAAIVLKKRKED